MPDVPADTLASIQSQLDRIATRQRTVVEDTPPPKRSRYSDEQAAVRLHSGKHPSDFTEEGYQVAVRRAAEAGITERKIAELRRGDCKWLWGIELGQRKLIPEESIRAYEDALEGDVVKARHRV